MFLRHFQIIVLFLILTASALLSTSCTDRPPSQLSRKHKVEVDTLFTRQVKALKAETDSLCEQLMEDQLQQIVDSLLVVRRAEIIRLRERVRSTE